MQPTAHPKIMREITSLSPGDCFTVSTRLKKDLDVPLHYHAEYELTLVLNGKGVKRVVGNSIGVMDDMELIFIGPNQYHAWFTHQCTSGSILQVTVQFHQDLFNDDLLKKNQLSQVRSMLGSAQRGILFPKSAIADIADRIINLKQKNHFEAVIELFTIFHALSVCPDVKLLSDPGFTDERILHKSRRIEKIFDLMYNQYHRHIPLAEAADLANMPPTSFSRFFKMRTGKTFVEVLNEMRLGYASRMLIDTNLVIAQIAFKCGFNNLSNFNRIFKIKKMCTPHQFRETYSAENSLFV